MFIATSLPVYATLSWFAWPELARVNLLFALACRLPIVALTIVAVPQA